MNKEELIAENARLQDTNKTTQGEDKRLREQFSKVLCAPVENPFGYSYQRTQITYSWEQIFCEVGKLLSRQEITKVNDWNITTNHESKEAC